MNQYLVVVQAQEGYPPPRTAPVDEAPDPPHPVVHSAVLVSDVERYLDETIMHWRGIRDGDTPLAGVAPCYVDAFQSARSSLLGRTLA